MNTIKFTYECPNCWSNEVAAVGYGYPNISFRSEEGMHYINRGDEKPSENPEDRTCLKCHHDWHSKKYRQ